tara:strand:+ start:113 stop:550 length:438 start_codon:yes stop_codon:yes gene_type:complete
MDIEKGIRFKCQGSGNCCVSRGSYGYVYLSKKDIKTLSIGLKTTQKKFIKNYCDETDGFIHLKELKKNKGNCIFLIDKRCSVYKSRPIQCRTWPFWAENMNTKDWNNDIAKNCPGVGKGKLIKKEEILKQIKIDYENEINIRNKS